MSFEKIAGYDSEKAELLSLRKMLHNASFYRKHGLRIPRGVVLCGEPGIGKSVLARSIADEGISLVELRAADCGENEIDKNIRNIFDKAREKQPAVLLLDELDKIAGTSQMFFMEDNDLVNKILLQEMDKLCDDDIILVVATCNNTSILGDALLRPGRFDRVIDMKIPNEEYRTKILRKYFDQIKFKRDFCIEAIAKITYGFTGAGLECLVNESGIRAIEQGQDSITTDDVRFVMNKIAFNGNERQPLFDIKEKRKIAIHEAGHALVAMFLSPDAVMGVSAIPQGDSEGHLQLINNGETIKNVSNCENEIAILLGGRVAERLANNDISLGSESDLSAATKKAYSLIIKQGIFGYEDLLNNVVQTHGEIAASEENRNAVNKKFGELMQRMDDRASMIINDHLDVLLRIADKLVEKNVLCKEELQQLIA